LANSPRHRQVHQVAAGKNDMPHARGRHQFSLFQHVLLPHLCGLDIASGREGIGVLEQRLR